MLTLRAGRRATSLSSARLLLAQRSLATKPGPTSAAEEQQPALSREEEQQQRIRMIMKDEERQQRKQMIAEQMREKTMREVNQASAGRRPEGISHLLRSDGAPGEDAGPQYAANYDDDRDEWGGPKGMTPRRPSFPPARRALPHPYARTAESSGIYHLTMHVPTAPAGEEPTRHGDWERKGRAIDF
jgi:hypothetical protein